MQDTGIGIPTDAQSRIFEAFQQADASITRKYGGTGLGLAISREYARFLGGELGMLSQPGIGSTFTLYLPIDARDVDATVRPAPVASRPPTPVISRAPQTNALAGYSVLIVEDDARNLYATTAALERANATVIPASSAQEAYARLKATHDVDIVLMDIMMPDIDGFQATREIHAMPELGSLPVIALTAKASELDRRECLAAGCVDYVVKPVDAHHLISVIERHLRPHNVKPAS